MLICEDALYVILVALKNLVWEVQSKNQFYNVAVLYWIVIALIEDTSSS